LPDFPQRIPQDWGFAPHPKFQLLLSQERVKLRTSNLARTITGSIRIKAHEKIWRKGSVGISRDCTKLLSQVREKLLISNLASTFRGSIQIKAHEKIWRKGGVGVCKDCPKFLSTPIIPGTGKATDFKFGQYIQRVHLNKSPLKILEKRERGRIQGLPELFGYSLLSQEWEKLPISCFASTFRGSIRTKAH